MILVLRPFEECIRGAFVNIKAQFKRRILHAPNKIVILVDSNE